VAEYPAPTGPTDDYGQPSGTLTGRSSNNAALVPPAGFVTELSVFPAGVRG
jgi:hypothetical protein